MTDIINNILKSLGYYTVPASFYGNIAVWKSWYDGNVRSFHRYQVYNGLNRVDCRRDSLAVLDNIVPVFSLAVDLEVGIFLSALHDGAGKSALSDDPVLP